MRKIARQWLPYPVRLRLRRWLNALQSLRRIKLSFPTATGSASASPFPFPIAQDNPLEALGSQYAPTKRLHHYLPYYWMHFRDIRFEVRQVLEIGIQTHRSIRMWEDFFPNAMIHGLDLDPQCQQFEGGRRKIHIGDQSDAACLQRVIAQAERPFDIVIDDGSHRVEHQLKSFDILFPTLSTHGIYVIEDTGGMVGDYRLRTVNTLKTLIDHILYWPKDFDPAKRAYLSQFPAEATWADRNVTGIAFYRWIVFVFRGRNPEDNPFLRPLPDP